MAGTQKHCRPLLDRCSRHDSTSATAAGVALYLRHPCRRPPALESCASDLQGRRKCKRIVRTILALRPRHESVRACQNHPCLVDRIHVRTIPAKDSSRIPYVKSNSIRNRARRRKQVRASAGLVAGCRRPASTIPSGRFAYVAMRQSQLIKPAGGSSRGQYLTTSMTLQAKTTFFIWF